MPGRLFALLVVGLCSMACDDAGMRPTLPASPTPVAVAVTGTWDARFSGTVQGAGTPQTDTFVMELRQDGARATGTLRYQGTSVPVPISGTVTGPRLTFEGRAALTPSCDVTVRADVTVEGDRLSGTQTQSTCEGTAAGQVTAVRR